MKRLSFWQKQPPTLHSMLLRSDPEKVHNLEVQEIFSILPDLQNMKILELGCGIGRMTTYLVQKAFLVDCVEFVEQFLLENQKRHHNFSNIYYHLCDIMEFHTEKKYDLIFVNWLLLYLNDQEIKKLLIKMQQWIHPSSILFFRESCAAKHTPPTKNNPTTYRTIAEYETLFSKYFFIENMDFLKSYIKAYAHPLQCYWYLKT